MNENAPHGPADLSPTDVFNHFSKVLLKQGRYRGDAHYLFAPVSILDGAVERMGTLRLEDYNSWASTEYDKRPACANRDAQARLLGMGRAILGLQFTDEAKRSINVSYAVCIPETVRQDQLLGGLFYDVYDDGIFIPADVGMPVHPDQPAIVRATYATQPQRASYSFIDEPRYDHQLYAAYQALTSLSQQS